MGRLPYALKAKMVELPSHSKAKNAVHHKKTPKRPAREYL
jgi:hypothetical protein